MNRSITLLLLAWLLAGCTESGTAELAQNQQTEEMDEALAIGQRAYEDLCAGCHEAGLYGAPKTGDLAAWEGRSWLWEAVLFEHARVGFNQMPAKGGNSQLDEATVTKAAEYMLTLVYPDQPLG